jgi:hypothetical protein
MRWWLRFSMGWGLLGQGINLLLLSLSLAPTVGRYLGCRAIWPALLVPPAILTGICLVGWAMDRWGWAQRNDRENRARSPGWVELFARLDRIERRQNG